MPISIRYLNDPNQECVIRPTPLISISEQVLRNKEGVFGKIYNITLTGHIIADNGFPLARDSVTDNLFPYHDNTLPDEEKGPYGAFDPTWSHVYTEGGNHNRPKQQNIPYESASDAMMFKRRVLRALFAKDGQRMEITPIHMDEPAVICYPRLVSLDFAEGIDVDYNTYTIQLEADVLLDNALLVDIDGNPLQSENSMTEQEIFSLKGRFIESYSDDWALSSNEEAEGDVARTYTITRNISAVGRDHYSPGLNGNNNIVSKLKAWENARDFVHSRIINGSLSANYPNYNGIIGSGVLNLISSYEGYNHLRNENINTSEGSYSLTESWSLSKSNTYETFDSSISVGVDSAFVKVDINGNIRGMMSAPASGSIFGGSFEVAPSGKYINSLNKYRQISNNGKFNIFSDIFKRANNLVAVELNGQPLSISVSFNEQRGDIGYTVSYDNRPSNIISGVLTEDITINDTHPGDVFASVPIIGRKTGPILQYIGTRTEYSRSVSINLLLDYTDVAYGSKKISLVKQKPSLVCPIRSQIIDLLKELSPSGEDGVRKYYLNPPQETWNPKTGNYSIQADWVYEKSY